jgi:hypothetical protein
VEDAAHSGGREVADPALGLLLAGDHQNDGPLEVPPEAREEGGRQGPHASGDEHTVFSPADLLEEVRVERKTANEIPEQ